MSDQPALPDPIRLAKRSISLLRRAGFSDHQAKQVVIDVCQHVMVRLPNDTDIGLQWIYQIQQYARARNIRKSSGD